MFRLSVFIVFILMSASVCGQRIADFSTLRPSSQNEIFQFPETTHTFQKLISVGDKIDNGIMPTNFDFTGYVPIAQSSKNGYLGINSEYFSQGGMTVMNVRFDTVLKKWNYYAPRSVDFLNTVEGTRSNCSGAVTPWNTFITCEETSSTELNARGYKKYGWCIEVDPEARSVKTYSSYSGDKLWKAGFGNHENAVIHPNKRTLYTGLDQYDGVLYKFVADNPEDLSSGKLFALKMNDYYTGFWKRIPNSTVEECNNAHAYATANGCKVFNGIEDVDLDANGKVYFAVKSIGTVFRFTDHDPLNVMDSSIVDFDVFVGNQTSVYGNYLTSYNVAGVETEWGYGNDNLAFDNEGNLWVLNDGSNNAIWVIGPHHNNDIKETHDVRIFGYAPAGAEPTGLTFTPDNKYIFMSFQHPYSSNANQAMDADSNFQVFNKDMAVVVARRENLGKAFPSFAFTYLDGKTIQNKAEIIFKTKNESFIRVYYLQKLNSNDVWENVDTVLPNAAAESYVMQDRFLKTGLNYYRIQAVAMNNIIYNSGLALIRYNPNISVVPNPFNDEIILHLPENNQVQSVQLIDIHHKVIFKQNFTPNHSNDYKFDTSGLQSGVYSIVVYNKNSEVMFAERIIKTHPR